MTIPVFNSIIVKQSQRLQTLSILHRSRYNCVENLPIQVASGFMFLAAVLLRQKNWYKTLATAYKLM